ncbi:hypothetical protein [Sphingomonas melonis]|uniref:Outer membrane cobalamin receptor n=1 Tax=Sphingomonas melonis TaxID=152682 RepID=A0A7Y9FQV5_9SPHN|nr:hypothetical protein [Sphingomonas melonis]NYD91781.1 outer membrane cobalamin receptor [Sphingomonas melonis]
MKLLSVSVASALQLLACSSACAQTLAPQPVVVPTADEMTAAAPDDTIVVTGTRDRSRTQFDTLAPVDVLSRQAIGSTISNDLADTLARLCQTNVAGRAES